MGGLMSLHTIQIEELPGTIEEFVAVNAQAAGTPQGGAAMMVLALLLYIQDNDLGTQCLAATVSPKRTIQGFDGYEGRQLHKRDLSRIKEQLTRQNYLPNSYIKGTDPADGYALPRPPYQIELSTNPYSGDPASGRVKLFVRCSGADSPRPVTVVQDEQGMWGAHEWSSLVMGVKRG
jgi:hypothetical protein